MNPVLKVTNISKSYGDEIALDNLSFSVEDGELFGLIGPDGAGKSTFFRLATTLLIPDKGDINLFGFDTIKDYKDIRKIVGYMPGEFSLYRDLTIEENLSFYATIFKTTIEENYHLIKDIYEHIAPFKKRKAGDLSGGMKQKLALSCALIHKPKILFLDEPTTGIDAVSRKELWDLLKSLKQKGVTIVVSTPYMDEASWCDRVLLLQDGQLLDMNSPEGIIANFDKYLFEVKGGDKYQLLLDLRKADFLMNVFPFGESIHVTSTIKIEPKKIENYLVDMGYSNIQINAIQPDIEDCFMDLMTERALADG